jgi:outer membrane protein OmpA-like peptidoglycan-associated protein
MTSAYVFIINCVRIACLGCLALGGLSALALNYSPRIDQAEWRLQKSELECRLWQPIPNFGNAVFNKKSGEQAVFQLNGNQPAVSSGQAILIAMAPNWRVDEGAVNMGKVQVDGDIELAPGITARLLASLQRGMSPTFSELHWFEQTNAVTVGLSAVNFQAAYKDYQACLAEMVPVSLADIQRSRVEFGKNSASLTGAAKRNLEYVARYLISDQNISSCFVDGHTDDTGRARHNLNLSKQRAEAVTSYLVSLGVPKEKVITRYHGERFPVVANTDDVSRGKNRRVTIRLD